MNKWFGIGRMVADPELNYVAGKGTPVTKFRLAVTRPFKKDETDFINCIAFGKAGETIAQYLTKGRQVAIVGRIQTGSYDAKDGTKRYTTDIVVDSFEFIGSNKNDNQGSNSFNRDNFESMSFEEEMTPVDDGDMPF